MIYGTDRQTLMTCDPPPLQDVYYDATTGRCTSTADTGNQIDGDSWHAACNKIATEGFACADGQGTCYADVDAIGGWCD